MKVFDHKCNESTNCKIIKLIAKCQKPKNNENNCKLFPDFISLS